MDLDYNVPKQHILFRDDMIGKEFKKYIDKNLKDDETVNIVRLTEKVEIFLVVKHKKNNAAQDK